MNSTSTTELRRKLVQSLHVKPGSKVPLPQTLHPDGTASFVSEAQAVKALQETTALLSEYQSRLAAQSTYGVLVVIQALDAGGKDGTIKHVMSGVNPAGVNVHSFKVPSTEEISHDFLWRYNKNLPRRGEIAIFNRSHYEEVLVVRVHPEILQRQNLPQSPTGADVWKRRFREINDWERYLSDNGIRVVKIFLNISKEEQRQRFLDRIDHANKNWKFSAADVHERQSWDKYQEAFSDMLSHTSTDWAPWHIIPADHKWFARLAAAAVIVDELVRLDPQFPKVSAETAAALEAARQQLIAEAPPGKDLTGTRAGKSTRAADLT